MACNVGGAKPERVTMVRASTRLAAVECDSVACAICDNRTTALPSPVGRSIRKGDTSLIAWPGPVASNSASGYTDMGTIARIVDVEVTGSAPRHQPVAQRPGDHREDDVVDVAVVACPQPAVVIQLMPRDGEAAVAGHR